MALWKEAYPLRNSKVAVASTAGTYAPERCRSAAVRNMPAAVSLFSAEGARLLVAVPFEVITAPARNARMIIVDFL